MSKVMEYLDNRLTKCVKEAKEKTSYIIMGQLGSRTPEKLDSADGEHDADYLVKEYRMAFGPKWKIWKELDK